MNKEDIKLIILVLVCINLMYISFLTFGIGIELIFIVIFVYLLEIFGINHILKSNDSYEYCVLKTSEIIDNNHGNEITNFYAKQDYIIGDKEI